MIVFINGPFGVGKTTTARLLVEKLPRATFFDPEIVGVWLSRLFGKMKPVADFQEYNLWPFLTVEIALFLAGPLGRTVVIPMTVTDSVRWSYIRTRLQARAHALHLFRLVCSEETLRSRIAGRPESEGNHSWCLDHVESGLLLMQDPWFGESVITEGQTPPEVANLILGKLASAATW
ncbi:MAG: ATP-binding protein [Candidatus Obscuribacterales bacterium]|nr:ATP-binding protein [Candidatus Obscuribacterales bacterium]